MDNPNQAPENQPNPLDKNPFQNVPAQQTHQQQLFQPIYYKDNIYNPNFYQPKRHTGLGAASMIIGICSLFICCGFSLLESIPIMALGGLIYLTGLILGIVACAKDVKNDLVNGMGITGIILCLFSLFCNISIIISEIGLSPYF